MPIAGLMVPALSAVVSLVTAALVLRRFARRRVPHLLLWGVGAVLYGVGGACEALNTGLGWNPVVFRLWYLSGAILVAAWLGQGTVYLVAGRKLSHVLTVVLAAGSIYAAIRVAGATLDPSLMAAGGNGGELSGRAISSGGVRVLTPFFNSYGTLTLVGGAILSAVRFFRKRMLPHRAIGSVLVAVGGVLPALGGSLSRLGIPGVLYLPELGGALLLLAGFLRATTLMKADRARGTSLEAP